MRIYSLFNESEHSIFDISVFIVLHTFMTMDRNEKWDEVAELLMEAENSIRSEHRIIELWGYGNNPGFPGRDLRNALLAAGDSLQEQLAAYESVLPPPGTDAVIDADKKHERISEAEWIDLLAKRRKAPAYFDERFCRDAESLQIEEAAMESIEKALRLTIRIALKDGQSITIHNASDSNAYDASLIGEYNESNCADTEARVEAVIEAYIIQTHEYAACITDMPDPVGQLSEIASIAENCGLQDDDPVFRAMIAFGEKVKLRLAELTPVTAMAAPQLYRSEE